MKNNYKKKSPSRATKKEPPLTKGNLIPILEDIKDLIKSTAVATQTVLRKEMNDRFDDVSRRFDDVSGKFEITWTAISEHTQQIKSLDKKVDSLDKKVDDLDKKIDSVEANLKDEMHHIEKRLSDKIDATSVRLDNHESRISTLERVA